MSFNVTDWVDPLYAEEVELPFGVPPARWTSTTGRKLTESPPTNALQTPPPQGVMWCYDSYGFRVSPEEKAAEDQRRRRRHDETSLRTWRRLVRTWPVLPQGERKRVCREGIPQPVRARAWMEMLGLHIPQQRRNSAAHQRRRQSLYERIVVRLPDSQVQESLTLAERDLARTFPSNRLFGDDGPFIERLRNVLRAYALHRPSIGYCQGMAFVAGTLLLQMRSEAETFLALRVVMDNVPYNMQAIFAPGFPQLHCVFFVFQRLLAKVHAKLAKHLASFSLEPAMYSTNWFMTIFSYGLTFSLVSRIWDMFLCEGWKPVYRVALALMKMDAPKLLVLHSETDLLMYLRNIQNDKDPDILLQVALGIKFKTATIAKYEREYHANRRNESQQGALASHHI